MGECSIGPVAGLRDGEKRVITVDGTEVGIFRVRDSIHAWRNVCPHQGGPVCQGRVFQRVVENLDQERRSHGRRYDADAPHIVCPWHGAEFDIRTGRHAGAACLQLQAAHTSVRGDEVVVQDV